MMRTFSEKEKKDWRKHLPKLAYAVNSTKNKATGYSPFFLLYGREPKLPIDAVFNDVQESQELKNKTHSQFVQEWESAMKEAHQIAQQNIDKLCEYNKRHYDEKAKAVEIKVGDLVLVRNMREREGKAKMRSYWEENLFKVTEIKENVPVYTITNIGKKKDIRVVHRNKLMLVNELPLNVFGEVDTGKGKCKSGKKVKEQKSTPRTSIIAPESVDDDPDDVLIVMERQVTPEIPDDSGVVEQPAELVEVESEVDFVEDPVLEDEDVPEEMSLLSEAESANQTFPYEDPEAEDLLNTLQDNEKVEDEPVNTEEDIITLESDSEELPVRRSARGHRPKLTSSYDKPGGELIMVPVGT